VTTINLKRRWIVAITGASGSRYGLRLLDILSSRHDIETHVVVSEAGLRVLRDEENIRCSASSLSPSILLNREVSNVVLHPVRDIGASIASGSFVTEGMVVVPCSMGTLASVAQGISSNLIHRAADVVMKERRKLILVPRETPLSSIHLENMLKLSQMNVQIIPAMPGFYHRPTELSHIVDMMVMKILDSMDIETSLVPRWGEEE
jgi:flavin prenyltransferase